MYIPEKARLRYASLTPSSKKDFLKRYKRLRKERKDPQRSALLCAGLLPDDIKHWPPKMRYMLHEKTTRHGLMVGTAAWAKAQDKEIANVRAWLDGWWMRNHQREDDATQ